MSFVLGCEAGAVWSLSDASLGGTRRWPGVVHVWAVTLRAGLVCNIRAISTGVYGCPAVNCGQPEMARDQRIGRLCLVSEVR